MIITCLKIFLARIIDVSLGVLRTIELIKNNTSKAFIIAFFEVFIWFIIAKEALVNESSIIVTIFYCLGYATGTYIGVKISNLFSKGNSTIQVISNKINKKEIKDKGFGISTIKMEDNKKMHIIELNNKSINRVISIIKNMDDKAFIIVNDSKHVINGFIK